MKKIVVLSTAVVTLTGYLNAFNVVNPLVVFAAESGPSTTIDENGVIIPKAPDDVTGKTTELQDEDTLDSWAKDAVDWMSINNITPPQLQSGYKKNITREEFTSLLLSVLKFASKNKVSLIDITMENRFEDTDSVDVIKAYGFGIVNGVSDSEFNPKDHISRQEAAMMMVNLLKSIQVGGLSTSDYKYVDQLSISDWAVDAVNVASNIGLFEGSENGFRPQDYYTREQAISVMSRLLKLHGRAAEISLRGKVMVDLNSLSEGNNSTANAARPISAIVGASNVRFGWTEVTPDYDYLLGKLKIDLSGHSSHHHEDTGVFLLTQDTVDRIKSSTGNIPIGNYRIETGVTKKADSGFLLKISW